MGSYQNEKRKPWVTVLVFYTIQTKNAISILEAHVENIFYNNIIDFKKYNRKTVVQGDMKQTLFVCM